MHMLKSADKFKRVCSRETRSIDRNVFGTDIVHMSIYAKSPYYKGVNLLNKLPQNIQVIVDGHSFKTGIKKHLNVY